MDSFLCHNLCSSPSCIRNCTERYNYGLNIVYKKISIWWNNTHVNAIIIYCDICIIIKNVKKRKKDIRYRKDFFPDTPKKNSENYFPKKPSCEYSVNDNSNGDDSIDDDSIDDDDDENEVYSDNDNDEDSLHLVPICYAMRTWFAYITWTS